MCVIGEQGLPSYSVGAAHYPVVAAKSLANFGTRFLKVVLNGLPQRRGQVGSALGWQPVVRCFTASFQNRVRLHVVVIVFVLALCGGTLRAIINNFGVAHNEMIHRGFFREKILFS